MRLLVIISTGIIAFSIMGCGRGSESDYSMASDSTSVSGLTGDSLKIVKTAGIQCKVRDVYQSAKLVSQLARDAGGVISHQDLTSIENDRTQLKISNDSLQVITAKTTSASIIARIPSAKLESFLYAVTDFATIINSSQLDINDMSLDYLANQMKQQNREKLLASVETKKIKDVTSIIDKKDEEVGQEIAKREIDAQARFSTVKLELIENPTIIKEVVANYSLADYTLPFTKKLGDGFTYGWSYFLSFLIALVHLWPFIIIASLLYFLYKQYYSKKSVIKE